MTDAATAAPSGAPAGSTEQPAIAASDESSKAAQAKAPEPSQPAAPKLKKYKVNGKDVEVDLSDEKYLDTLVSKGLGSDERFREAKGLMDQLEKRFGKLPEYQKNPFWKVIADGADPLEVAEALLLEKIRWEEMSAEEREYHETKRERDQLKADREKAEKAERERAKAEASSKAAKEIDDEVTTALKALGRKPTPRLIARVAETLLAEYDRQLAPLLEKFGDMDKIPEVAFQAIKALPAGEAVGRVHKEYLGDIAEYLTALPIDEVKKLLPKDLLDGLRKADVDAVLAQDPVGSRRTRDESRPVVVRKQPPKQRQTTEEFFKSLEKKLG